MAHYIDAGGITRREMLLSSAVIVGGMAAPMRARRAAIEIERGVPQLFVDDYLIEESVDLKRTIRQPKKENDGREPILALTDEFGAAPATLEANCTILYDPRLKKWVMFALAFSSFSQGPDRVRLYRFTSRDAMSWTKGDDGAPQRISFDLKDAASGESATNIDLFSCCYDRRNAERPYKGWLHFANWAGGREGTYVVSSADGIDWERGPQIMRSGSRTIKQQGRMLAGPGDATIFYHDARTNRFLANLRFASPTPVGPDNRLRSRAYVFVNSLETPVDLERATEVNLVPAAEAANGDLPHDEYYASTAWRYGSLWLGGLKVWHGGGDYPYSAAGSAFLKLAVSRDGLHWRKVPFPNDTGEHEVFIPNGPEGGSGGRNDGGYMTEFSQGPLRVGNELIYYYGCSSYGKNKLRDIRVSGGGIFRARMRLDGFVSVDRGMLVTPAMKLSGEELLVNGVGPIGVEVLDASGLVRDAATISGEALRHVVRFKGLPLARLVVSRGSANMRLRFTVRDSGSLYSFTVA